MNSIACSTLSVYPLPAARGRFFVASGRKITTTKNKGIGISELVEKIKEDFRLQRKSDPMFNTRQVELEISFSVEKTLEGGLDLQVVQAKEDRKRTNIHTVRVVLEPFAPIAQKIEPGSFEQKLTPKIKGAKDQHEI